MKYDPIKVPDLDTFESCDLRNSEIQAILDNDNLCQATPKDVARIDPETGEVWALCWVKVGHDNKEQP